MVDIIEVLKRLLLNKENRYLVGEAESNQATSAKIIYDDKNSETVDKEFTIPTGSEPVNQKPVVSITYSPEFPKAGEVINLNSTQSFDPDGIIIQRNWSSTNPSIGFTTNTDKSLASFVFPANVETVDITLALKDNKEAISTRTVTVKKSTDQPPPPPPKEVIIPIVSVTASSQDSGKEADKTIDGNYESRWSADGDGESIEFTFDKVYEVTKVGLTGYHYDKTYTFEINGKRFENLAGRPPNTLIEYDLADRNIVSNKVKIIGHGNSETTYNSYREIEFKGIPTGSPPPPPPPPPPEDCPGGQCKDPLTKQCRPIGPDETRDNVTGECIKIGPPPPPPPPPGKTVRLLAFADNDVTSDAEDVNAAMLKVPEVNAFMFIGDGPYSESGTKWTQMMDKSFGDKKDRLIFSRGNHDEDESESKQTQEDIEEWFPGAKGIGFEDTWLTSKQIGNVFVISMDTQDLDIEFKRDQFNWVSQELTKAKALRAQGLVDWIVVLFHKPAFTLKSSHSPYTAIRFLYKELFRDAQVDFVISGHNHNTQLWFPMIPNDSEANGEGTQLFKYASDGKTFDFAQDHGQLYIVSGHAGHEWNSINDDGNGVKNVMHYRDSGDFGFTQLDFTSKKANVKSIDSSGKVHFEYNVTREGSSPPPPPPPPDQPKAVLEAPTQAAAGQTIQLNASKSVNYDSLSLTQTLGDPQTIQQVNQSLWQFVATQSSSSNFQLGFQLIAKKGNKQSISQVAIQIVTIPPPPPPPEGEIDEFGILWIEATGEQTTIEMTRDEDDDDRWSGNYDGLKMGAELTMIAKSIDVQSDGHFALKHGGGNHSGSGASKQRWYDTGLRSTGKVQLQWEGPHPSNHDFNLPKEKWFITDIGKPLEGDYYIGLKWIVNALTPDASPSQGGIRCRMYVDRNAIGPNGKPNNNWELVYDFVDGQDGIEVLEPRDYTLPDEWDCEIRRSGHGDHEVIGGGLHVRRLK